MRLLDLFCGAGGCSVGYTRAGFDVVGVDIQPQPHYPYPLIIADALDVLNATDFLNWFDAIHASPPCQAYSRATAWRGNRSTHPDLIAQIQTGLRATSKPYVIENVQEARPRLRNPLMICGTTLGLPIRRHRYFELSSNGLVMQTPCHHRATDYSYDHGNKQTEAVYRDAMGCQWMTVKEAREAIPPAYTEYVGTQLAAVIRGSLDPAPTVAATRGGTP